jgi:translation initiation factor IF-2
MIDLIAELEEFTANPKPRASGVVIESQLDKGRGPVATVIVRRGTLKRGDVLVSGSVAGRVRAMLDENGKQLKEATPSTPVLVMGWDDVPTAGDLFDVMESEKEARANAADAEGRSRSEEFVVPSATERLTQLLEKMRSADEAELRLIIKADANGSLEAIRDAIGKIAREGGRITTIQASVGGITENDVSLAEVTEAVIVGFNVRPDGNARRTAEAKGIEVRTYRVIYELLDEIEQMLVGRLAPDEVEAVLGAAEVRAMFKVPRAGTVAGCYVTEGDILRNARARLVRQGVVVYEGRIASLRRFKDDVRSVAAGFECGIGLENFNDVKEGDIIEAFELKEVARQ